MGWEIEMFMFFLLFLLHAQFFMSQTWKHKHKNTHKYVSFYGMITWGFGRMVWGGFRRFIITYSYVFVIICPTTLHCILDPHPFSSAGRQAGKQVNGLAGWLAHFARMFFGVAREGVLHIWRCIVVDTQSGSGGRVRERFFLVCFVWLDRIT
ncbi:hypothetical protein B0T17DRAFT_542157 [Bombardia bombarda]|uniref:Uncharacterized protein n=1 Tax=Bombardia bombarda TaxID=252184 RepID=A0AA39WAY9_9PEZI|nr:hypothetical protein B0T17DRAFT_542157 [Bombardia bombarda]